MRVIVKAFVNAAVIVVGIMVGTLLPVPVALGLAAGVGVFAVIGLSYLLLGGE